MPHHLQLLLALHVCSGLFTFLRQDARQGLVLLLGLLQLQLQLCRDLAGILQLACTAATFGRVLGVPARPKLRSCCWACCTCSSAAIWPAICSLHVQQKQFAGCLFCSLHVQQKQFAGCSFCSLPVQQQQFAACLLCSLPVQTDLRQLATVLLVAWSTSQNMCQGGLTWGLLLQLGRKLANNGEN